MKKTEDGGWKRPLKILSALALAALLFCAAGPAGAETKLMVVSDLHYLAPELYRGSDIFLQVLRRGDGKYTQGGEELLSALYRQILLERPDALILTGDLTYKRRKGKPRRAGGLSKHRGGCGRARLGDPGQSRYQRALPRRIRERDVLRRGGRDAGGI